MPPKDEKKEKEIWEAFADVPAAEWQALKRGQIPDIYLGLDKFGLELPKDKCPWGGDLFKHGVFKHGVAEGEEWKKSMAFYHGTKGARWQFADPPRSLVADAGGDGDPIHDPSPRLMLGIVHHTCYEISFLEALNKHEQYVVPKHCKAKKYTHYHGRANNTDGSPSDFMVHYFVVAGEIPALWEYQAQWNKDFKAFDDPENNCFKVQSASYVTPVQRKVLAMEEVINVSFTSTMGKCEFNETTKEEIEGWDQDWVYDCHYKYGNFGGESDKKYVLSPHQDFDVDGHFKAIRMSLDAFYSQAATACANGDVTNLDCISMQELPLRAWASHPKCEGGSRKYWKTIDCYHVNGYEYDEEEDCKENEYDNNLSRHRHCFQIKVKGSGSAIAKVRFLLNEHCRKYKATAATEFKDKHWNKEAKKAICHFEINEEHLWEFRGKYKFCGKYKETLPFEDRECSELLSGALQEDVCAAFK
jgi:hypothetical protein